MGKLRKVLFFVFCPLAGICCLAVSPLPLAAQVVKTSIDISYSYTKDNDADIITYKRSFLQKYEIEYESSLSYFYDLSAGLEVEYDIDKATDEATKKALSTSLDLEIKSDNLKLAGSYSSDRDDSTETVDEAATTSYTNKYLFEAELEPSRLPEVSFKIERDRDFERQAVERVKDTMELDLKYEIGDLEAGFSYTHEKTDEDLPSTFIDENVNWEADLSYSRDIADRIDLQLDYRVQEEFNEEYGLRNVFISESKDYRQEVELGLKSGFVIPRNFVVSLAYDMDYEQDFLEVDYDYELSHKLTGEIKRDFLRWASTSIKYEGTSEVTYAALPYEEDEETVKNKLTGNIKAKPLTWLALDTKAERELTTEIVGETGRSVNEEDVRKYETTIDTEYPRNVKFSATQSYEEKLIDGLIADEETTYNFEGEIELLDLFEIKPSFEISLNKTYEPTNSVNLLASTTRDWESDITIIFEKEWLEIVEIKAEHSFGYNKKQELDEVLNLTEETDLTEDSKLSITVSDWIQGMELSFEVSRKGTDTKGDEEPMIIDRTLSLKLSWDIMEYYNISSSYEYDDKGDGDDTLSFDASLSWKKEFFEITAEYEYDKTFSEEVDESNTYDLNLKIKF